MRSAPLIWAIRAGACVEKLTMELLILVTLLLCLFPATSYSQSLQLNPLTYRKISPKQKSAAATSYAVIFDAGSTGSRVHVFHFDQNLDLLHVGDALEFNLKVKPGLSAYAANPEEAAESLVPLLQKAETFVPVELRPKTPLRLGATAGLRFLNGDAADKILQAVRDMFQNRSTLKVDPDEVVVIDGTQEGSYLWLTINYLLKTLGKEYSETVGVVDLGGGSVQMAYAISEEDAAKSPNAPVGEEPYIREIFVKGKKYYVYVHSYLHYGKEASRVEIIKASRGYNRCILAGFEGNYTYQGVEYNVTATPFGGSFKKCRKTVLKALKVNKRCPYINLNCTFGGIWNGGGREGQKNLYIATAFYYLATDAGFVDANKPNAKIRPVDYKTEAEKACKTKLEDAKTAYPNVDDDVLPYICMDLVYQYTLLADGFGLDPFQEVTVVKQLEYEDSQVEAAWPLGSAIEAISSLPNFERFMYFI